MTSKLEANMKIPGYDLCIIYTWGEGCIEGGGGEGSKPCDCPNQLAVKRGEEGLTKNLVLDFQFVLCTTPPLIQTINLGVA
jgi:hypothetical protein